MRLADGYQQKGGGALKRNPEYLLVLRVVYNIIVRACIISDLNQFFNTVQTGSLLQLSLGVSTFPSCGPVFCPPSRLLPT